MIYNVDMQYNTLDIKEVVKNLNLPKILEKSKNLCSDVYYENMFWLIMRAVSIN